MWPALSAAGSKPSVDAFSPGTSELSRLGDYLTNMVDKGSGSINREARQLCDLLKVILTDSAANLSGPE